MSYINDKTLSAGRVKIYSARQDYIKSIVFFSCLVISLMVCIVSAYTSSGPVILGTELNGDGSVEYMCLGNSCNDLHGFTWNDKK